MLAVLLDLHGDVACVMAPLNKLLCALALAVLPIVHHIADA